MKIVKFKDGEYAIRRYQFLFGYEYLNLNTDEKDYWWTRTYAKKYCFGTLEEIKERLRKFKIPKLKVDYGVSI